MKFTNLAATALILGVSLLGHPARAQDMIKIGAVTPSTGMMAPSGNDLARSFELAVDRINAEGGLLGKKLVLIRGSASTAQEAIAAVDQLVSKDKVDLFIGTIITPVSNAASEAAMNYGKLYWEEGALANELTERGLPNFVRSGPNATAFAKQSVQGIIELVAKKLGKQPKDLKIWIEHEDSAYGTSVATVQAQLLKNAGAQVFVGAHSARAMDLTDAVLRAKAVVPDLWLMDNYVNDLHLLLKTARDQNFKPSAIICLGTGDTPETLAAMGKENLEGVLLVSYPRTDTNERYGPGAAAFAKAFTNKYGSPPFVTTGMTGYVGMRMLAEAIKAAGSVEYAKVIKAAAAMDKPEGFYETGYGVKFDSHMQNIRAMPVIAQWQNGKVVTIYPLAAAPNGAVMIDLARK